MVVFDNLKQKVKEAEQLVVDTRKMYLEMKEKVKKIENELKENKKYFNRSHRNWVRAKKLVIKTKSKLSRYPRETRNYGKNHLNKLFEIIEK